jgi:ATP-binding cassette subfamily F protein uup
MSLLQLHNLSLSYGTEPLFDDASLVIHEGDHVCLLGRNGAGKSTLLKVITGEVQADDGQIQTASHLVVERLSQELPDVNDETIYDFVAGAFDTHQAVLSQYYSLSTKIEADDQDLEKLASLQREIEALDAWQFDHVIQRVLGRLDLDGQQSMQGLSGGNRRLVALAKCLVKEPDLLLLDEPTNHLDIERIQWLEKNLGQLVNTWVVITHDREFADVISNRIVELDRGNLTAYEGNLSTFYKLKEVEEATEARERERLDKKLAQEEVWIRQGIKARRTRNEGRVRALKALRKQVANRRDKQGKSQMQLNQGKSSGKRVFDIENLSKSYSGRVLFSNFDLMLQKGDRLGILGPNGSGKTTLLKIMLGKESPNSGIVKMGTELQVAYFDQSREMIDLDKTVFDNIADGNQYVQIGDKAIHVMSYLQNYLFSPNRARSPASALSGGEFSRLMLAKLMTQPFNLLILDEPTNDLDLETLEILESQLADYTGTLIVISHDRQFIDNTVSTVIHLDGKGNVTEAVGGYSDWYAKYGQRPETATSTTTEQTQPKQTIQTRKATKLTYNDQRELEQLPAKIEQLESELEQLHEQTAQPDFYSQDHATIDNHFKSVARLEAQIENAYERWEILSNP